MKIGLQQYSQHIHPIFMSYLTNTAASVRNTGISLARPLCETFGPQWIIEQFIPAVQNQLNADKKGYNYRICCLKSLGQTVDLLPADQVEKLVMPHF